MKKTKIIGICVMLATMLAVIMLCVNGCGNADSPDDTTVSEKTAAIGKTEEPSAEITETMETAERPAMPTEPSKGLEFELNNDGRSYSVFGIGTCKDTNIVIPAEYNDLPVTSIWRGAFAKCHSLTSVEIPEGVTSIGDDAFYWCKSLTSVTFGENSKLTSIGDGAFEDCSFRSIEIPSSVTSIGNGAFYRCISLTSIEIPSSVTSIGNNAFRGCSSLTSITVDDHNQAYLSIDGILFSKDRTILIRYPSGKTEVSYTIPEGVTSIGNYAFYSCDTLTSIEIPSSVMNIGDGAFDDCNNLSSIEMPSSVTSIGNYAFYSCERITSIEIPSSVTRIGRGAFSRCERLTSIEILSSVTSIEIDAFNGCESLTSITYKGTKAQWNQLEKGIRWNNATGDYTIHCTDGDIKK